MLSVGVPPASGVIPVAFAFRIGTGTNAKLSRLRVAGSVCDTGTKFDKCYRLALSVDDSYAAGIIHTDRYVVCAVVNRSAELDRGHRCT